MVWRHLVQCASFAIGLVAMESAALATPAIPDAEFTRQASAAVARIEQEDGFSGVILLARNDQILLRKAAGFADREQRIPVTPDMQFPIESVTKQFTATAIMMLVGQGKLSLDDPISKYYPPSPAAWRNVRIKHLLTNSSGIEDYWVHRHENYEPALAATLFKLPGDLYRAVQNDSLGFEPGTGFSYSNAGFSLLAQTIEQVSRASYDKFLHDRIFGPLGMRSTGFGDIPDGPLKGYIRPARNAAWQHAVPDGVVAVAIGAGGIYSTVDDMLRWSLAQDTDRLLSPTSRAAMLTDYGFNYGFGIRFAPKFGRRLIWHTGNDPSAGFATIFDRFPDDGLTVIAMTNSDGPTDSTATLLIEGKLQTFPANPMRKAVEEVERLYFGREP